MTIHITIHLEKGKKQELESIKDNNGMNGLEKALKLYTTISTTNMHMFNFQRQLQKYNSIPEIIQEYYGVRMDMYHKRKQAQLKMCHQRLCEVSNRARFIQEVVDNTLDLRSYQDDEELAPVLQKKGYDVLDHKYEYLTKMPLNSMNQSKVQKLIKEKQVAAEELDVLEKTSLTTIWLKELDAFENEYGSYKKLRESLVMESIIGVKEKTVKKVPRKKVSNV